MAVYLGKNKVGIVKSVGTTSTDSAPDSGGKYLVQVIDCDGTILKQDHLDAGAVFTLPSPPTTHEKLIFQEWSTPADIVNNEVVVIPSDMTIGAVYTTKSGLSEFDIILNKGTGLDVTLNVADGVVDWGDGVVEEISEAVTHTYVNYGAYTITWSGTTFGTTSNSNTLFGATSSTAPNYILQCARFANITKLPTYCFYMCHGIKYITLPDSVTSLNTAAMRSCETLKTVILPNKVSGLGQQCYQSCYSLETVALPKKTVGLSKSSVFESCFSLKHITLPTGNIGTLGSSFFNQCYQLSKITIPSGVTVLSSYSLQKMRSLLEIDMRFHTSVPTLQTFAASQLNTLCKIYVPDELYDTWITKTNWAGIANNIYRASEMPDKGGV